MRAAVLVFVCVIGVTLALPSFRTLGNKKDARMAALLEKILSSGKETRTQQLRSESGDEDDCPIVAHPCEDAEDEEAFGLCVFDEFGKLKKQINIFSEEVFGKPLFSQTKMKFYWEALDVVGEDNWGIVVHLYAQYGYEKYMNERTAEGAQQFTDEQEAREQDLGCQFETLLGEFGEDKK